MQKRATVDHLSFKRLQKTKADLTRIQSFPYSEELRSIMNSDVICCSPDTVVRSAVKTMTANRVSSIIIVEEDRSPAGIITESDILKIVADDNVTTKQVLTHQIMSRNLFTLSPENTIYRALAIFSQKGIKHLPLTRDGKIAGIITLRQLLKLRYPEPMTLLEGITGAESVDDLKQIKDMIPDIVSSKLSAGIRISDIAVMISMINQDIHRKAMFLVLQQCGQPPAPFCLFVTGSHGRFENLLAPDQDHCLVIEDDPEDPLVQYQEYWVEMSSLFSDLLAQIGFIYCPGEIMCRNPIWRKSLKEWQQQIQYWVDHQVNNLGRFATLLFDAYPIYGDISLFHKLNDFSFDILSRHHEIHRVMFEEEGSHQVPLGFLGRFITEKSGEHRGEFEMKRSGLIFIIESVRILALRNKIRETSTLKRIKKLVEGGFIHSDDGEYFEAAYLILLHLALTAQIDKIKQGKKPDTFINPNDLSQRRRRTLRHAFEAVTSLQDLVAAEFGELVL